MAVGDLALAVGAEEEHAARRGRAHEVAQQLQRRAVRPVQVVEDEHDRRLGADLADQRGDGVEEAVALRVGLRPGDRARRQVVGGRRPELRQQDRELGRARAEPLAQRVQRRARRPAAQHLDHGLVRRQRLLVEAPVEDDRAVLVGARGQLGRAARLADAGVAGQQDERALALDGLAPAALEVGELDAAADERVAVDGGGQRRRPRRGLPRRPARRDRARRARCTGGGSPRSTRSKTVIAAGPGRRAELLAQQRAQLLERPQRLGRVARGLVDLHQQPVRGLAERRGGDRGARGLLGGAELAPALAQPRLGQRLQRAQPDRLQLAPLLGRPAALGVGQERLQVGGERLAGALGGQRVVAGLHRGLGLEDRGARGLDVDAHVVQPQPQLAAPGQHAVAQRAAQLRQQRAQRRVGGGGRTLRPEHVDQLVARAAAGTIEHEVGEEQTALPPRSPASSRRPPASTRTGPHNRMSQPSPTFTAGRYRLAKVSPRFRQREEAHHALSGARN